jgi:hypothetical protein
LDIFEEKAHIYSSYVKDYFVFDERVHAAPLYASPLPYFEREVYQEDDENIVFKREDDGKIVFREEN